MKIVVDTKFNPGRIVATPGFMKKVGTDYGFACLEQHLMGDWGLVGAEDRQANEQALQDGNRLFSVYALPNDPGHFYIITEADRSVATFLLPEEY